MKKDIAIEVNNLGKKYKMEEREKYLTLRDSLVKAVKLPYGLMTGKAVLKKEEFWALKDVSFEVKKGEVLGIIGRNGAGKSTLLKILSRITEPTTGKITLRGKTASLLEVGTGFHAELTGRENIYINGAILGMKRREINKKFDKIVDFSGVEKFLDTPVKKYSSGMKIRLAFAVAAHLEAEILLIDEVLAVGDAEFQKKCLGKMKEISTKRRRTVLFVSHNMGAIQSLCGRCILLERGKVKAIGEVEKVISKYLTRRTALRGQRVWKGGLAKPGINEFKTHSVCILNEDGKITSKVDVRKPFWVKICYSLTKRIPYGRVGFILGTSQGIPVFEAYDFDDKHYQGLRKPGRYCVRCKIPGNLLKPNKYNLSINAGIFNIKNLASIPNALTFEIEETEAVGPSVSEKRSGLIRPKLEWEQKIIMT